MIDLFNDNLDKIQSSDLYRALVDFMRLNDPVSDRPAESWRLDFKRQWSDRALQAVAGFANTFGGVLIIGVDPDGSDQSRPGSIFGTSVTHEVKLQIASGIATNISPIPSYRIAECADPSDSARRMWVVQVRAGTSLHLLTKKDSKNLNPIYVRNESGNLPADAARIRALVAERIEAPQHPSDQYQRAVQMRSDLYVTRSAKTPAVQRERSATRFLISALPKRKLSARLDKSLESSFQGIVEREFPKTSMTDRNLKSIAEYKEVITRDRYEIQILHADIDFERRWTIKSNGDFGFASQVGRAGHNDQYFWSLFDITIETIASLKAVLSFWRGLDYFGEFLVVADLGLHDLILLRRNAYPHGLASVFYSREQSMDTRIVSSTSSVAMGVGLAEVETNTAELDGDFAEITGLILNQLLRCGGYSIDFSLMKKEIRHQIEVLAKWQNNPELFHVSPHPSRRFLSDAEDASTS